VRKPAGSETAPSRDVTILSVSPIEEDHVSLEAIFGQSEWAAYTSCQWKLHSSSTISSAVEVMGQKRIPIVICEGNLLPGTWRDMLERIGHLSQPPFLIVTSRLADCHLWAEALNLGAYDVLAKPFDKNEVVRIVSLAWLHWKDQCETSPQAPKMWMAAAG
jgi:DNA-binding NtrC family response regulator